MERRSSGVNWGPGLHSFPFSSRSPFSLFFLFPLFLHSFRLEVGPLNCSYGVWGSTVSFPNRVWDGATAEIKFDAL